MKDPEAARRLAASHLRLVIRIARRYRGYGFPLADLIGAGNLGLVQALARFEPERGFRFSTYAMWWIKAAIQEYIVHNWSLVQARHDRRRKRSSSSILRRLKSKLGELEEGDLGHEAVASIARALEVGEHEVIDMNRRLGGGDASLSARMSEDGDREWIDMLVDESQNQEERTVAADELTWRRGLLAEAMQGLSERERHIIEERRLKEETSTLEDLAQIYGVSRERIRQIEVRAFEKLQKAMLASAANDAGQAAIAA